LNVLVFGATGFIGGHIARAALARGWRVRALRRRPGAVGAIGDVADQIEWIQGALPFRHSERSEESQSRRTETLRREAAQGDRSASLREAMGGCDVAFHAAAAYPHATSDITGWVRRSVTQMRAVLAAAADAGVGRLVYTSTLTTVGPPQEAGRLADERDFYVPGTSGSAYYEAKFAMEMEAFRASAEGLPIVILNPTAVFGPGDVKPTTGELLLRVAKGQFPFYFRAMINMVDGRDVAAAHIAAAERGRIGQRYILGGHNLTLKDGLTIAARGAGVAQPRWEIPRQMVDALIGASNWLRLPLPDNVKTMRLWQPLNSEKAQRELGLHPRPFEETARDTIAWFRENHYL
jgi:dihydroflavonol-4-reductase